MKKLLNPVKSLTTGIFALTALVLIMIAGSFTMLKTGGYESLNSMPLFRWLYETTTDNSWWLVLSLACLAVIGLNTVFCSAESLMKKTASRESLLKISPQVIHAGFLLIMIAHVFSSYDSFHTMLMVNERNGIGFPGGEYARISDIISEVDEYGRMQKLSARVTVYRGEKIVVNGIISPNNPVFYKGMGIYLKDARVEPYPSALIEVSSDSGAKWALAGGILFFLGNILLVGLKLRHDSLRPA